MLYLSSGFPFPLHITPQGGALAWKACSTQCKLKPQFRIRRDKLMKQFSLRSCDFIRWIMGADDFMDQMTASARSVDSGLSNYPVNMMNGDSGNEHQCGHGGSPASETRRPHQLCGRNVLWRDYALWGPSFLSVPSICPLPSRSLSCSWAHRCFCTPVFLLIWLNCFSSFGKMS